MRLPRLGKKSHGFTLVELLIVLAIIAILISIGLASIRRAQASAHDGQRRSDIQTIRGALEQFYADRNVYPGALVDLQNNPAATNPYLRDVPEDPVTNAVYYYDHIGGSNQTYCIGADLETNRGTHTNACNGALDYVFDQSD